MRPYKILDLYRDLPRLDCGECGKPTCFAFAGSVFLEKTPLSGCARLTGEELTELESKMAVAPGDDEVPLDIAAADMLGKLSCSLTPQTIRFFGSPVTVSASGVTENGKPATPGTAYVVLSFLGKTPKAPSGGGWGTYLELPGTGNTINRFNDCTKFIARAFGGNLPALDSAAGALGGIASGGGSADRAYVFQALHGVQILFKFWDRADDGEARSLVGHSDFGRFTSLTDFEARAEVLFDPCAACLETRARILLVEEFAERLLAKAVPNPLAQT